MTQDPQTTVPPEEELPAAGGLSPGLLLLLISGVLGLVIGVAMLFAENAEVENARAELDALMAPRPVDDWPAPEITLTSLDGEAVSLSDFVGQPVFVNFWATWCPPCVAEMPAFDQFMSEAERHGAVVLALNVEESPDDIRPFLADIDVDDVPVLLDEDSQAFRLFQVGNMPTTFIIDAEGMVRYFKIGEVTVEDLYGYLDMIDWTLPEQS